MQTVAIILVAIAVVYLIFRPKPEVPTEAEVPPPQKQKVKVRHCKINRQTEEIDFGDVQDLEVEANKKFKKGDRIGEDPFDFYVVT